MPLSEGERRERKRQWYVANKERVLAQQKERYLAKREEILSRQRAYIKRKAEELGYHPSTPRSRRWREENLDRARAGARRSTARCYRADPVKAAIKRAKTILSAQSGVATRMLPMELVEAKAAQLLVRKEVYRSGLGVGECLTDDERRARKAARWQRWYQANKAARDAYQAEYREKRRGS